MAKIDWVKSDLIKMDSAAQKQKALQSGEIKGDNFFAKESPAPKSDLNVKVSVDDGVGELGVVLMQISKSKPI